MSLALAINISSTSIFNFLATVFSAIVGFCSSTVGALTTFGVGIMKFIGSKLDTTRLTEASKCISKLFSNYKTLGWFGEIFLSHGILVYLAFALAIVVAIVLNKTKVGLFLRSVGESPQTADAQGINVSLYKYVSTLIGSAIAGLGGLYYVMDRSGGTTFVED